MHFQYNKRFLEKRQQQNIKLRKKHTALAGAASAGAAAPLNLTP